jgi:hypothetical protein
MSERGTNQKIEATRSRRTRTTTRSKQKRRICGSERWLESRWINPAERKVRGQNKTAEKRKRGGEGGRETAVKSRVRIQLRGDLNFRLLHATPLAPAECAVETFVIQLATLAGTREETNYGDHGGTRRGEIKSQRCFARSRGAKEHSRARSERKRETMSGSGG